MSLPQELAKILAPFEAELASLRYENEMLREYMPKTVNVNDIPGRRTFYTLHAVQTITTAQNGIRGNPMFFQVGQDGPFVLTTYPTVIWRPSAGTQVGRWRPIASWPLPDQIDNTEFIDLSYELRDEGPGRNMQGGSPANQVTKPVPVMPSLISRPNNQIPLPFPQVFDANSVISCTLTYDRIAWTSVTAAIVCVELSGYRITNR